MTVPTRMAMPVVTTGRTKTQKDRQYQNRPPKQTTTTGIGLTHANAGRVNDVGVAAVDGHACQEPGQAQAEEDVKHVAADCVGNGHVGLALACHNHRAHGIGDAGAHSQDHDAHDRLQGEGGRDTRGVGVSQPAVGRV